MSDDGEPIEGEAPPQSSSALEEKHRLLLDRFDSVAGPQSEIRAQALEARRFVTIPGAQWEGAWGEQFENSPRPEIDKITKSLEKIETDYRENRLTVDFVPANDMADADTAETLDGLHRADSYHFKAMQARDNGFQEGIRGGFGAWRCTTELADPDDPDSEEQRINPGRVIVDADQSVYFDPASKLYDKSDANWAFVISADPRAVAVEKWGDAVADFPVSGFKWAFDWYTPDVVRTAEYYEIERVPDRRITLKNDLTGEEFRLWASEVEAKDITDLVAQGWKRTSKKLKRKRVRKYLLNGSKILKDCGYIVGEHIPIVPFYGRRDWVDNMERFRGHVLKKMDRQRIYNTRVGKLVEQDSLAPRELPIFDPTQIDPVMGEDWARANIDRLPFLRAHALRNPDGTVAHLGPIGKLEPPQIQPATGTLLQIAATDLTDEDEAADQVKSNVSADAMDIAAARVDAKSGIYLDNMRQSIQREAEIYLSMAREIYYEPGRKVETLTADNKDGTATLQEGVLDQNKVYKVRNDLSRGRYKVIADVQESTSSKRQKTVRENMIIAERAAALPNTADLAEAALLMAVMNQDGEGMAEMQDFARNKLIQLGVVKPTPEEQAQIAQAANENSEPSAADTALKAQAEKLTADAGLSKAKTVDALAAAHLKGAQAEAIGGPATAPEKPTGLHDVVKITESLASADLKHAQAEHLRHGMGLDGVRAGHEIALKNRQQDHAERQPAGGH